MLTLGIETSCDETAAALVEDGRVLSSEVSSSVHLHARYGGVVPEIASRYHTEYIYPVLEKALSDADRQIDDVDLVSVTQGPGLPGSLLVGIAFAKALALASGKPIIGVDHLYAHILSCFLGEGENGSWSENFPFIGMVVSGGHTSIYVCEGIDDYRLIGRTKDDAIGEAFDKVAKIMDLGYPGGPLIESRAARYAGKEDIDFPRSLLKGDDSLDFSFSGIKTAVMYYWRDCDKSEEEKDKIAFSFQEAVVDVIVKKLERAFKRTGIKTLAVGGGVINNSLLRDRIKISCDNASVKLYLPDKMYCADNAAMIALLGEEKHKLGQSSDLDLNASPAGCK